MLGSIDKLPPTVESAGAAVSLSDLIKNINLMAEANAGGNKKADKNACVSF